MRTPWSGIETWLDVTRQLCSVSFMVLTPSRGMRGSLEAKGLPCRLNETHQVRRLEAGSPGAHVQFYPLSEYEAYPGAAPWGYLRGTHWRLGYPIETRRDLGKWHASLLELADLDESFQVRRGVVWSAPRPERCGQEPAMDVETHRAARHPP